MVFGKFKNYYILRYIIYDFLKKVSGGNRPTCLVRVHCALSYLEYFGTKNNLNFCQNSIIDILPGHHSNTQRQRIIPKKVNF